MLALTSSHYRTIARLNGELQKDIFQLRDDQTLCILLEHLPCLWSNPKGGLFLGFILGPKMFVLHLGILRVGLLWGSDLNGTQLLGCVLWMPREHFRLIFPGSAHVLADLLRLDMYASHQAQFVKTMDLHT